MDLGLDARDLDALVKHLGDRARARQALALLIRAGAAALPAVRRGLTSSSGDVRMYCARALDRLVDEDAWPDLIALLGDVDPRVRAHTLHALACDRCKQDDCRPDKADVLPQALRLLRDDPSHHVRQMAVEVVARWVPGDARATDALVAARDHDPKPGVRKKAGWFAPGGPRFERKLCEQRRRERRSRPGQAGPNSEV